MMQSSIESTEIVSGPFGGSIACCLRGCATHHLSSPQQPAWLTFIALRDVGEAERTALAHGGKVLSKAREYPQRGRQKILADPQGAVFAVLHSSSGDPDDGREPGQEADALEEVIRGSLPEARWPAGLRIFGAPAGLDRVAAGALGTARRD